MVSPRPSGRSPEGIAGIGDRRRFARNLHQAVELEIRRPQIQQVPLQQVSLRVLVRRHQAQVPRREEARPKQRAERRPAPERRKPIRSLREPRDRAGAPQTWFRTTPAIHSAGSSCWQPSTSAAAVRVTLVALTTSTTGACERLGQFRRAVRAARIQAVVQAAVAFDQVEPGGDRMPGERRGRALEAHQVRIEIARRLARSPLEPGGVDVVGPLLEGAGGNARCAGLRAAVASETRVLPDSPESPAITRRGSRSGRRASVARSIA